MAGPLGFGARRGGAEDRAPRAQDAGRVTGVTTANKAGAWRRAKDILYLIGVNLAVFVALFVVFELAVHIVYPDQNPWLRPPFVKSRIRVANPIYGHGLVPNFDGEEVWGNDKSHVVTNSFGFKDASMRQVPLQSTKTRVLFLGNSFTEGAWECPTSKLS
jgi:hypothetical protein